ncbi:MAG TPA: hypothetical protein VKY19_21005 [Ktedonosporobacter sp.]|jgi:hypothetical protein|nr:hypothetical protein [Ktedonosporobacter sp.]
MQHELSGAAKGQAMPYLSGVLFGMVLGILSIVVALRFLYYKMTVGLLRSRNLDVAELKTS